MDSERWKQADNRVQATLERRPGETAVRRCAPPITGSVLRPGLSRIAGASRSRPTTERSRSPRAPGSRWRRRRLATGPTWPPDGRHLYFTSGKDGCTCVWGQRIEAVSHLPAGPAFAVLDFHGRLSCQRAGWPAADGRIARALTENPGNIWMMSRSGARRGREVPDTGRPPGRHVLTATVRSRSHWSAGRRGDAWVEAPAAQGG